MDLDPKKILGERIDKLRRERNLSYQELADKCEIDKAQIYKICMKGVDLRYSTLLKISNGLNITILELVNI